ncbi:hypothetical protein BOX15_Mlig007734g2 [Macrostomum lignano]|uniref:C2H2-type domain-containing protein n=1 Tax=Macrostomum lignano TaxID=282301 RepID=A0A267EDC6_9PLAT|nr:hypothetical protein BOX15_Mlig007734g2 [Macrostomum lignano]
MIANQQCQKRPVPQPLSPAGSDGVVHQAATRISSCVPPKKRPRLPESPECSECFAVASPPLDLTAKPLPTPSLTPDLSPLLAAHQHSQLMLQLNPPSSAVGPSADSQWQAAAAAAAMYAQCLTSYLSSIMPPPPPPRLLPPAPPPLPTPVAESARLSSGETDFRCSCGRRFANLVGLTVHMRAAGHGDFSASTDALAASAAVVEPPPRPPKTTTPPAREQPKLVRGQDMWINSETEQTREILRCIRCRQSFRTLPELTMHMVRSRHYAEIISSAADPAAAASGPAAALKPAAPPPAPASLSKPQPRDSPKQPAYICPDLLAPSGPKTPAGLGSGDSNPLYCLQRLVDKTAGFSEAPASSTAAAAAASPSAASTSSTSEAASVMAIASEDPAAAFDEPAAAQASPSPPTPQQQQQQQQQQSQTKKKIRCQFCSRPFANKGQVRLHVSKGKCPGGSGGSSRGGRGSAALQQQQQQQQHQQQPQSSLAFFEYFFGAGAAAAAAGSKPIWW